MSETDWAVAAGAAAAVGVTGGAMTAVAASMAAFARAAAAGEFAVNQTGGEALIGALVRMGDWIDTNVNNWGQFEQEPPLGSTSSAQVMKPFMVQVATDANGFITQLMAFRKTIADAEQAIRKAMENYRTVDEQVASTFTGDK